LVTISILICKILAASISAARFYAILRRNYF
jgi:hypothetical protein